MLPTITRPLKKLIVLSLSAIASDCGRRNTAQAQAQPSGCDAAAAGACIPNEACAKCLDGAYAADAIAASSGSCAIFEAEFCRGASRCDCGFCKTEIENFFGCTRGEVTGGSCTTVDCRDLLLSAPLPAPAPPPSFYVMPNGPPSPAATTPLPTSRSTATHIAPAAFGIFASLLFF